MDGKIMVVGGAGYVGSILLRELLDRGYSVKVVDRLYFGDQGIREIKDRLELIVTDIRLLKTHHLNNIDAVINLSGLSNDPTAEYNPKANYEMNTVAAIKLAQLCKEAGVSRYIFASSASIYDFGISNEKEDTLLTEEAKVNPKSAYSKSKYDAEKGLLALMDDNFCPVILRKGTIFGFSPRMRYDLVVNTFVCSVFRTGNMTIHYGGEMWRPLIDIRDVARAYIMCAQADENKVKGQVFNLVYKNFRISELALRVRETLRNLKIKNDIIVDHRYKGVRSYRISGEKIKRLLGFEPCISIEESVADMVDKINKYGYTDFTNPLYYNINWMKLLEQAYDITRFTKGVFEIEESHVKTETKNTTT